ncbi:prolyl aminopeptidase [Streptomyces cocklensis]|jgi:proline iminopeptidase|uniref:Proline iminopeptidase n=1 Tax=Actinacidiphila cocklensis TaxID=887465 RepID=A0A9W4GSV5_9ACTN|nr:prolyl aminopeptidase [Actinacidiphila cocklensis]MDD1057116.1 prolyl aminopeptidase [Actinacidiphila cocklensis]WSX78280.1 prolyl aminopeptidase [Streptomyces sp. NBC_00899]CAG6395151.1 putative proline iminopeptidase [Actinacidiphila cocklensis]
MDSEPYDHGMLDVGEGNLVYWEQCGNPAGKPALVVHGGPGSGCTPGHRTLFDPQAYRAVLFDQRNCGRSLPHASDPATDLAHNTTDHLVADMEQLRRHLGIERWLLMGGSWGSTLILAYAQRHPERVTEIVINGVTTTRRAETDWLYRGVGRFFPGEWERFRDGAGPGVAPQDVVAAYAALTEHPDAAVRERATADWCTWEDAVLSLEPSGGPRPYSDRPSTAKLAMVRITSRYFSHGAWLPEGALIDGAARLTGIPGALFHGRLDLSSPVDTAYHLVRGWPDARLTVVDDSGHKGSATMSASVRAALAAYATR